MGHTSRPAVMMYLTGPTLLDIEIVSEKWKCFWSYVNTNFCTINIFNRYLLIVHLSNDLDFKSIKELKTLYFLPLLSFDRKYLLIESMRSR